MAAAAATLVAGDRPDLVDGLVLIGPFVRNGKANAMQRILLRVAMAPPWAAASWKSYLPKLYAGSRPDDFEEYRERVVASLRRPGYAKAFSLTTRTNHDPAEVRLGDVTAPTMVIMGDRDPDFADPAAEAGWIGKSLNAEVVMIAEAGHYPQSQQHDFTTRAVLRFLEAVSDQDIVQ
jgi:pimeloyl-ACP methyl ester carboxylesterase